MFRRKCQMQKILMRHLHKTWKLRCDLPYCADTLPYHPCTLGSVQIEGGRLHLQHRHMSHDDVRKRKYFRHYWPFVREIRRSPVDSLQWPVDSLHKGPMMRKLLSKQSTSRWIKMSWWSFDITVMAPWRLKPPVTRRFVQQLVQTGYQENIKASHPRVTG